MSEPNACPEPNRLRALLDGGLSDQEQAAIQSHLEGCESCQRTLESLVAGKDSWSGAARQLAETMAAREAALEDVMQQAKRSPEVAHSWAESALSGPVVLDFLQPSEKSDILGRLGHYDVIETIGRGGMGVVLKAFDSSLRRIVAIKVLLPHLAANKWARFRFVREAQAAAAVAHDHVVAIHAVHAEHEPPYLVMQFIEGKTLQDRIDQSGPLQVREILRIGLQTASGLAAAHAQGIVHRDIKPANILLENGVERVKLTDFGLARAFDDASLTHSGVIAGTPQFMSPEQARGETVDHRSDLFSLGSVLYLMCVGHAPFRATTTVGVLKRVCDDLPRPIREVNPDIPDWLVGIISQLLAKNPADRFESAQGLADLLGQCLAHVQHPLATPLPPAVASIRTTAPSVAHAPAAHLASSPTISDVDPSGADAAQVKLSMNTDAKAPIRTVHPMYVTVFWLGWMTYAVLLLVAALVRFDIISRTVIPPASVSRLPLLMLLAFGQASLVLMVILHAVKNRDWRATALGPQPALAALAVGAIIFGELYLFATWDGAEEFRVLFGPPLQQSKSTVIITVDPNVALAKELRDLVAQYEQDLANVRQLVESGVAPTYDVLRAERSVLEAKIRLATAESRSQDAVSLYDELVKLHESMLALIEKHFAAGTISQSELSQIRKELTEARIQRETARQQSSGSTFLEQLRPNK